MKNSTVVTLLCFLGLFGVCGLHRFYVGRKISGLIYLLTLGIFGLGTIIDLVKIANNTFTDKDGNPIINSKHEVRTNSSYIPQISYPTEPIKTNESINNEEMDKEKNELLKVNKDWEISTSFSQSSSSNFARALYLAKEADKYEEHKIDGLITYQAYFSSNPQSYLKFIMLYELVSGWRSTAVMINGELIDRKIIGGLNYCYGDKCRNGRKDFCYGASYMTENPFGCHRLQISACNNPWWSFSKFNGRYYVIDKKAIYDRAYQYSTAYRVCPSFNWHRIQLTIYNLPNTISVKEYQNLAGGTTLNLNINL